MNRCSPSIRPSCRFGRHGLPTLLNGRVTRVLLSIGIILIIALALRPLFRTKPPGSRPASIQPVEMLRAQLTLENGRLHRIGHTNTFSGLMIERYPGGALQSRSVVADGLLHGLSEGWFTNGQKQVTENFTNGVSHGLRTKWYPGGQKHSEAQIVGGHIHGPFRRWYTNGVLAEEAQFDHGQADGACYAYFDTGYLKRTVTMQRGTILKEQSYQDGELMLSARKTGE